MKKVFDNPENVLYNITRVIARCSMVLDVKRIINTPGGRIPFDFTEDFSDVDFGGVCPAVRPVSVVGQAENIAGMLRLQFDLTTTLSAVCDRCGAPFDLPYESEKMTKISGSTVFSARLFPCSPRRSRRSTFA